MTQAATQMAQTSMGAPYDLLRAIRCMNWIADPDNKETRGNTCGEKYGFLDWSVAGQTKTWKCRKCKAVNTLRIVEVLR